MAYNKKYKKSYKPSSYGYNQQKGTYAYHDIDENHDWIKRGIEMAGLQNNRYIVINDDVKEGEINAPGFADGTKLLVVRFPLESYRQIDTVFVVNNKEALVSDFGCAVNAEMCRKLGVDLNFDTVYLQEVEG